MITEITIYKGKAKVYFDGICQLTVRSKDLDKCSIEEGMEIEPEECINRLAGKQFNDCYESALCILDVSSQTRAGMIRKLTAKGYVLPVCEAVSNKLTEMGLIDEQRFAERIASVERHKPTGIRNVRRKLLMKGIDPDTIDSVTDDFDEAQQIEACKAAAYPLLRKYRDLEFHEAKRKISQSLARKGFTWDICSCVLDELMNND